MKFTCVKENLSRVLSLTTSLAGKSTNLPILSHVLISASESKVNIITTNLEVAIQATLRAKVEEIGSFTVPAKTLAEFVSLLPGGQVSFGVEGGELLVESGSSHTKIKGVTSDEFPIIPKTEGGDRFTLEPTAFGDALSRVVVAVSKNEIRPELSGVHFGFFTDRYSGLVLAATDSYRLAEMKMLVDTGNTEKRIIVPARAVYEMIRLLHGVKPDSVDTQACLCVGANQVTLQYDQVEMTTRLIDGKYPEYAQIIPTSFKTNALFPKETVMSAIKAAGLFAAQGVNSISLDLNVSEKTIAVSSTSAQTGEHSSSIDGDVSGEENSILLNYRYVFEGLQQIAGDNVVFKMNSGDTPCLFEEQKNPNYTYIVMPIRQ